MEEEPTAASDSSQAEITTSSRHTQRFSESASKSNRFSLSSETITAQYLANVYHTVEVNSSSPWSAKCEDNTTWLHCYVRVNNQLTIWCDKNDSAQSRSAHIYVTTEDGNQKSILVTQQGHSTSPKKSKAWIWVLVFLLVGIGTAIGIGVHNQREEERREVQALYNRHTIAINDFDRSLNAASMDDIDVLETALDQLRAIKEIEDNYRFDGTYRYSARKQALLDKVQELYDIADRRYQLAPSNSEAEKRNKNKRRQLYELKQKI